MLRWLSNEIYGWVSWVVIPVIVEIIPAIGNFIILIKKYIRGRRKKEKELEYLPQISLLVPVYNSAATLEGCIASIDKSTYPNELMDVFLINNKSQDNSFEIFVQCQEKYKTLRMQWLNAGQGKSKALNLALFNSEGKYIIHIDSDGKLEEHALYNMVRKFENNKNIHCMTGIILTEPALIEETKKKGLRFIQKLEFMEYNQAFLVGRNYNSEYNNIFSLSGAFSAFRKSTILKTQLYNTNTICEDAHLTFQVKKLLNQAVALCETAIFMVDPIESIEKLYTQRQRWQIGELEVLHMFHEEKTLKYRNFFKDANIRLMCFDHTVAFPRLIWCFALFALGFYKYDMQIVLTAFFWIYVLYVFTVFLNYICSICFLWNFKEIKKYYAKKVLFLLALPAYNMVTFFIRMAGIINSLNRGSSWKTLTYKEELKVLKSTIKEDLSFGNKKEKTKMNKRWLRFFVLVAALVINIFGALYFLERNTQNNYKNYAKMQDNLLYSIVNTTEKDVDTLITAIGIARTSGSQSYYIYNKSLGEFVVYQDKPGTMDDVEMEETLLKQEVFYRAGTEEQRVMSSVEVQIDDFEYVVALGTLSSYVDSNLNTSQYNMFVITEFAVLYLVLVCISLRALSVDKKHGEEMDQLTSEFMEYKNKLGVASVLSEQEKQEKQTAEGFYSPDFLTKLASKLGDNEICYKWLSFSISEEMEEQLINMQKEYNVFLAKEEACCHVLLVNNLEQEEQIRAEIKKYGGTDFGKSV